jgi:hypothetical protein
MKNKKLVVLLIISAFFITTVIPKSTIYAQGTVDPRPAVTGTPARPAVTGTPKVEPIEKLKNPIQSDDVKTLLAYIVNLAIYLGSIIAVLMFIWIGFQFVIAQGNESKVTDAKEWFKWAVIGTALLIGSKVILEIIKTTLIDSGLVNKGLL